MKKILCILAIISLIAIGCTEDTSKGTAPSVPHPKGSVTGYYGCKNLLADAVYIDIAQDQSCINYEYDGQETLTLRHINAGFNCCPDELDADISLVGDTLVIEEYESLESGGCDCLCLFDLDIEVDDLDPGIYFIKVIEVYVGESDEKLFFEVDLSSQTSGSYCVNRYHYPWNMDFNEERDQEELKRMYDEIIAMIGVPQCDMLGECRYIGIGSKPCGGPWKYIIYSTTTVDEELLMVKVQNYNDFEDVLNHRYGYSSDCSIPNPPRLGCVGGVCKDLNLQ